MSLPGFVVTRGNGSDGDAHFEAELRRDALEEIRDVVLAVGGIDLVAVHEVLHHNVQHRAAASSVRCEGDGGRAHR